jgi:hypothetical protein
MSDVTIRFRMWVSGELVCDDMVVMRGVAAAGAAGSLFGQLHAAIAHEADVAGDKWLVELHDPDAPPGDCNIRFGTDTDGMVLPVPMPTAGRFARWLDMAHTCPQGDS